ncbi:alpha/beta fold hydrolase [Maribacter sp. 2210JD10-5]|uniref:alpha/beta fold hydrolase n=1 Tax=Maribacter sp. 2210JD10-5 TaxID=3386272 RepID=UPI0039BCB714
MAHYQYTEKGEGHTLIFLHGIMGGLSNFQSAVRHFELKGYRAIVPELPVLNMPISEANVVGLTHYLKNFIAYKKLDSFTLIGNSVGGHISLMYAKLFPEKVKALVLTGSSGLYERSMGRGYPKRGNYNYIQKRTQEVFFDPTMATKEIVDDVFAMVNDNSKLLRTLSLAKSAIRHNVAGDLPYLDIPTCIIWGKNDTVTPAAVALEFNELMPFSELFWIAECGHAPMMEHPEKFNNILGTWLETQNL